MKKIMISQPIEEKTKEEFFQVKEKATKYLQSQGYEVIDTMVCDELDKIEDYKELGINYPYLYLSSKSIRTLSRCDGVYFTRGWSLDRTCRIDRLSAIIYKLEILEENENIDQLPQI